MIRKKEIKMKKQYAIAQETFGAIALHKGGLTFEEGTPKLYTLSSAKQMIIKMRKNNQRDLIIVKYNNGVDEIIEY